MTTTLNNPTADLLATPEQKRAIFAAAKGRRMDIDDIRGWTPDGSISKLTRGQASDLLDRLNAGQNRPKRKRRPKAKPGTMRMISDKQRRYIDDLLVALAWSQDRYAGWLKKSLGYDSPEAVMTSKDAYRVIEGLKGTKQHLMNSPK